MRDGAHRTRPPAELAFDDGEVNGGRHGPTKPTAPADAVAAFGPALTTGAAVSTGADAAGGEISAGAKVGLGDGEGFGATCAAPCTDDHKRPYHGCDASDCAAADADAATGVGDNVT
jgi:hypothetical protein